MSHVGWIRVATGLQKVAEAALQQSSQQVGTVATRAVQHGVQMVEKSLARQQPPPVPPVSTKEPRMHPNSDATVVIKDRSETSTADSTAIRTNASKDNSNPHSLSALELNKAPCPTRYNSPLALENQIQQPGSTSNSSSTSSSSRFPEATLATMERVMATTAATGSNNSSTTTLPEGTAVPSTRIGRAVSFASLGVRLAVGTAAEGVSRVLFRRPSSPSSSIVASPANADRLATSLRRMRGAAMKMGQMLSIQDETLLPPALTRALEQVRQGAEAMPSYQLEEQMKSQLGEDWRDKFVHFEDLPFAAASIGQVHRATVATTNESSSNETTEVVVKVQYPGVARSIESDLRNLSMLVTFSGFAPKGLFLENIIRVGQEELKVECDYKREMVNQERIRQLVESDPLLKENRFVVPSVVQHLTSSQVITSAYRPGGTIDKVANLSQEERNRIGRTILYLTMKELFVWRFMQTDPNWGNFLYDVGTETTSLIDFGAAREYSKDFVDGYLRIVWAAAQRDEATLMEQSHRMKFLTGAENEQMLRAHKLSGFTVGEPFWRNEPFDFRGSNISTRMGEHTSVFLRHRLTPPPAEIYTLHRKLAGAYLLCIKLGAVVQCRDMLEEIVASHVFGDGLPGPQL